MRGSLSEPSEPSPQDGEQVTGNNSRGGVELRGIEPLTDPKSRGSVVPLRSQGGSVQSQALVALYLAWVTDVRRLQPSSIRSIRDTLGKFIETHPNLDGV